jgi:hypothetical protein
MKTEDRPFRVDKPHSLWNGLMTSPPPETHAPAKRASPAACLLNNAKSRGGSANALFEKRHLRPSRRYAAASGRIETIGNAGRAVLTFRSDLDNGTPFMERKLHGGNNF